MPTKTCSGAVPPPALDRSRAWSCFLVNLLVCPGVGSLMARRRSGLFELGLALAGVMMVLAAVGSYFNAWMRLQGQAADWGPALNRIALGVVLILLGWLWSFCTSLLILRRARG